MAAGQHQEGRQAAKSARNMVEPAQDRVYHSGHLPAPPLVNGVLPKVGHLERAEEGRTESGSRVVNSHQDEQAHHAARSTASALGEAVTTEEVQQPRTDQGQSSQRPASKTEAGTDNPQQPQVDSRPALQKAAGGSDKSGTSEPAGARRLPAQPVLKAGQESAAAQKAGLAAAGSSRGPAQGEKPAVVHVRPTHSPLGPPVAGKCSVTSLPHVCFVTPI